MTEEKQPQATPLLIGRLARLKYLFEAEFEDGTFLKQTPEDRSALLPEKSAFYDVVQRLDEVVVFTLEGEGHTYQVDLRDGRFYVDARPFSVHIPRELLADDEGPDFDHLAPPLVNKRRLIFLRRRQHDFTVGGPNDGQETDQRVRFCIGWQATVNLPKGKQRNIQAKIAVD